MFIIVDKITNKITQTIDKNYGIQISENEVLREVSADFIQKYRTAKDYDLIFDESGQVIDLTVIKTWEQWQAEQPIPEPEPTQDDYLIDLDYRLSMIELGL